MSEKARDDTASQPPRSYQRRGRRIFALGAILVGLVPFALVELTLRWLDFGRPSSYTDPFVGFSRIYPLFEPDAKSAEYHTANSRLYFFAPQRFRMQRAAHGFRAFCLGGSTILGHPYESETAFPKWLELELSRMDPSRSFEIVNCGGMSYASYRLIPILEEVLEYEPDLIIVMTGHNEFLEDRTYRSVKARSAVRVWIEDRLHSLRLVTLLRQGADPVRGDARRNRRQIILKGEVDAKLDHESGYASYHRDEKWRQAVIEHFRLNLHAMVRLCREAGVPIILVNPGSNLRNCRPFKSEHRADLSRREQAVWTEKFHAASEVEQQDPASALALYREAELIDNQYAQLAFRIARCLDRLGRYDEARENYVRAKELDVCPLRILEAMNQAVSQVARETGAQLVDARGLLEERSANRIAGYNCYVDQVHPSIDGHQLITQALVGKLVEMKLVGHTAAWGPSERRRVYRQHLDTLGELYLARGRTRVEWLENWARRDRLREDTLPLDAGGYLDLGSARLDLGERKEALDAYRRALKLEPSLAAQLLDHSLDLFRQGRPNAARLLAELVQRQANQPALERDAQVALMVLALEVGDAEEAARLYATVKPDLTALSDQNSPWLAETPHLFDRPEQLTGTRRRASDND